MRLINYFKNGTFFGNVSIFFLILFLFDTAHSQIWNLMYQVNNKKINSIVINSKDYIFASAEDGIVYSRSRGNGWFKTNLPGRVINTMFIDKRDIIYLGIESTGLYQNGLYTSTDNGNTFDISGLSNQIVYSIVVNDSGTIFAGTNGNVFRSSDGGLNWKGMNVTTSKINALLVTKNQTLYAGSNGDGLFKSTNNGNTWSITGQTQFTGLKILSLAVDTAGNIFAGTDQVGMFITYDNGNTWQSSSSGLGSDLMIKTIATNSNGEIYCGTNGGGVYRSTTNGYSWIKYGTEFSDNYIYSMAININGFVYVGTKLGFIYKTTSSTTGGITLQSPTLLEPANNTPSIANNFGLKWQSVPFAESYKIQFATDTLFIGNLKEFTTQDTSYFITKLLYNFRYYWRVMAQNSEGSVSGWSPCWSFVTEAPPKVFWEYVDSSPWKVRSLLTSNKNNTYAGSGTDGIYKYYTKSKIWERVFSFSGIIYSMYYDTLKNIMYAGASPAGLLYSVIDPNSEGERWYLTTLNDDDIQSITTDSIGTIYAGGFGFVHTSTDTGSSWKKTVVINRTILALAINKSNGNILAGTFGDGVYISKDKNKTWEKLGFSDHFIRSIILNKQNHIFVVSEDSGVYRSTDNGKSFQRIFKNNPNIYLYSIILCPNNEYYLGSSEGVYRSNDEGKTWRMINGGLDYVDVRALAVTNSGYLFAGVSTGGVYKSRDTLTEVKKLSDIPLKDYSLSQNYPNPFNPSTTIEYSIPNSEFVKIILFNALGQEIKTIVNEFRSYGKYSLQLNLSNLPSGLYFYQIQTNKFNAVKKLLLLK